jgi:hypothetical protein
MILASKTTPLDLVCCCVLNLWLLGHIARRRAQ